MLLVITITLGALAPVNAMFMRSRSTPGTPRRWPALSVRRPWVGERVERGNAGHDQGEAGGLGSLVGEFSVTDVAVVGEVHLVPYGLEGLAVTSN